MSRKVVAVLPIVTVMALTIALFALDPLSSAPVKLRPPQEPVPATLFGLHIHRLGKETTTLIPFGSYRLWDVRVQWNELEPQRGVWKFEHLDDLVSRSEALKVDVLLPLGLTARWASSRPDEKSGYGPGVAAVPENLDDWKTYVTTVVNRYKGRVHAFEIWNEPNLPQFFTGTPDQLVAITSVAYKAIKTSSSENTVVCPAPTGRAGVKYLDTFLSKGGGRYCDVIGFHFYTSSPEDIPQFVSEVRNVMAEHGIGDKPIWNTETGWDNATHQPSPVPVHTYTRVLNDSETPAFVARAYLLSWASGVSRFFYYSWDHYSTGLIEPDGKTIKPAGKAYAQVEDWMVGATVQSCSRDELGVWTCELKRSNGYSGWILWAPDGSSSRVLPATWHAQQIRTLDGKTSKASSAAVTIGPSPILVEHLTAEPNSNTRAKD